MGSVSQQLLVRAAVGGPGTGERARSRRRFCGSCHSRGEIVAARHPVRLSDGFEGFANDRAKMSVNLHASQVWLARQGAANVGPRLLRTYGSDLK